MSTNERMDVYSRNMTTFFCGFFYEPTGLIHNSGTHQSVSGDRGVVINNDMNTELRRMVLQSRAMGYAHWVTILKRFVLFVKDDNVVIKKQKGK